MFSRAAIVDALPCHQRDDSPPGQLPLPIFYNLLPHRDALALASISFHPLAKYLCMKHVFDKYHQSYRKKYKNSYRAIVKKLLPQQLSCGLYHRASCSTWYNLLKMKPVPKTRPSWVKIYYQTAMLGVNPSIHPSSLQIKISNLTPLADTYTIQPTIYILSILWGTHRRTAFGGI